MSFKAEFQRLIEYEEPNIEEQTRSERAIREKRRVCFQPIRAALENAVESFGSEHVGVDIYSDKAVFYYKRWNTETARNDVFMRWFVESNNEDQYFERIGGTGAIFDQLPGVKLIKTTYFQGPPIHKRTDEYIFEDGNQALGFLLRDAAAAFAGN